MKIGALALQGGYAAHGRALTRLGHTYVEVRTPADLDDVDGLVLPGGESTTQLKLTRFGGLNEPLDAFVRAGRPVLATCAGLILSAVGVESPAQESYGWLDIDVSRNAWGRQIHSFEHAVPAPALDGTADPLPLMFIRAPRITRIGACVEVLATIDDEPILVRHGAFYGATFHPELTDDLRVHRAVFGQAHASSK